MAIKKKNPILFLLFIAILLMVIFISGYKWYQSYQASPADTKAEMKNFVVKEGETPTDVALRLQNDGIVRSSKVFLKVYTQQKDEIVLQPGVYKVSAAMTPQQLVDAFRQSSADMKVTLLEGWRVEQMAQKLEAEMGIPQAEFLKLAKEGYMFPDTYFFNDDTTVQGVVSVLQNTFEKRLTEDLLQKIKAQGLTPEQGVILASLVEREGRSDKVRQEVASIMLKRLKMGMKLDIDATVRYAMDSVTYKANPKMTSWWGAITQEDYSAVKSPYNTYLNTGLPPGPICNPSLASLKAVANADPSTPYVYYYHDSQGNSYYAKTLEEHVQNHRNHP
jgi:UPF0755 protein